MVSIQRNFLWGGGMDRSKICWVGWDNICQPKDKGGLGIKNLKSFNDSLLCKWKWRCLNDLSASWFNLLHFRYGSFAANFLYGEGRESLKHASIWWRDMWKTGGAEEGGWFVNNISSILGDGNNIAFWKEKWLGMEPLSELYPSLFQKSTHKDACISNMGIWNNNMWSWKVNWMEALDDADIESLNELHQLLEQVRPNRASSDRRRWSSNSDGSFSVRSTYMVLQDKRVDTTLDTNTMAALKRLWKNNVPSKVSVFGWRLLLEKLPTREALFCKVPPPKSLLIATPIEGGEFPLLLFLHGYLMYNSFYSQLIQHVASHGFIVIAPQLYEVAGPDINDDIYYVVAITNWLSRGLSKILPPNIIPNLEKLALGGHSRGGKTTFAIALGKLNITTDLKFSAIIGVDPIDGIDTGIQTYPHILTYVPHSFNFEMPTLVFGSGLGDVKKNLLLPPCSPKGVNHENFFNECNKPSWHFVAEDYGHNDMMDDDTNYNGVKGRLSYCFCKNGESRKPMRIFVGGVMTAFLKAYIVGDNVDLLAIRDKNVSVPLKMKFDYIV
ncbi:uncharacterized protein LOC123892259 [Trifolium pratense]|uniref:uncharacterized protein LOC123892259 n=1 Tax=Trifolium pratense TaxID=57577 RepID=UPI001E692351|nr:uncharacterized protein LOC123892259 [Trifolium pratense]